MRAPVRLFLFSVVCLNAPDGLDRMCALAPGEAKACPKSFAWHSESCVIQGKDDLVPDLLKFPKSSPIPDLVFEHYPLEKIVSTIIYRFFQENERPKMSESALKHSAYDLYANTDIVIQFNSDIFGKIIENGFLNQHITGTTTASRDTVARAEAEDKLIQFKIEAKYKSGERKQNHLRPKYAYTIFNKSHASLKNGYFHRYGDTLIKLKDFVKKQSLLSNGDSLKNFLKEKKSTLLQSTFYRVSKSFEFPPSGLYYESQILGKLPFSSSAYVLAGCFGVDSSDSIIKTLKRYKLSTPVYSCKEDMSLGFLRFVPDKLLYGDAT